MFEHMGMGWVSDRKTPVSLLLQMAFVSSKKGSLPDPAFHLLEMMEFLKFKFREMDKFW